MPFTIEQLQEINSLYGQSVQGARVLRSRANNMRYTIPIDAPNGMAGREIEFIKFNQLSQYMGKTVYDTYGSSFIVGLDRLSEATYQGYMMYGLPADQPPPTIMVYEIDDGSYENV